ncbi:MAG: FAD:protein FMN transferase [Phycisphaerales bacterium]
MSETGATETGSADPFERAACSAMGTRFEIVIAGCDADRGDWGAVAEDAMETVAHWHARLTRFEPGSFVRWLAEQPAGLAVEIDRDFADLLALCAQVWRSSGGAFDVAGGRYGELTLDHARPSVTMGEPGIVLDFGAVAKGFVIDLIADDLRDAGVTSAIVHGGTSTVRAIGGTPRGEAWAVRVGDGSDAPTVALRDAALSVSRNDDGAPVAGHVVDHSAGFAASGAGIAAVLGASAAACDAWSTALIVLGDRPHAMDSEFTSILPAPSGRWEIQGPGAHAVRLGSEVGAA